MPRKKKEPEKPPAPDPLEPLPDYLVQLPILRKQFISKGKLQKHQEQWLLKWLPTLQRLAFQQLYTDLIRGEKTRSPAMELVFALGGYIQKAGAPTVAITLQQNNIEASRAAPNFFQMDQVVRKLASGETIDVEAKPAA